jgi:hypothetical protein
MAMSEESLPARSPRDRWPLVLGAVHVVHTLWFARLFPDAIYDPDLIGYFVYWRNWVAGLASTHAGPSFVVPKPLLLLLFGPLDSAPAAFAVSALAAGALGALVYLVARSVFDRTIAIACSLALLLDVDRASLALRSSADFHLTVLLFAAMWASLSRRWLWSGIAIGLAALIKPVALPCAVHLLAVEGPDRRRAMCAAALSLLAIPAALGVNQMVLGSAIGAHTVLAEFAAMTDGTPMPTGELLRFALWIGLVKTTYVTTAPFGMLGLVGWIGADRTRLSSPFLLVPVLLLFGYVAFSIATPFVAYFRFFWLVQVWFLCCIVAGMVEVARRAVPGHAGLRATVVAGLLAVLADGQLERFESYRTRFAGPSNEAMAFVGMTTDVLARERRPGESILAPVAYLPHLLWTQDDLRRTPALVQMADAAPLDPARPPAWIFWVPQAFLKVETRRSVEALLAGGEYRPAVVNAAGTAALFVRTTGRERVAALAVQ